MARLTAFQRFAIGLLGYTMLVILWGAYVRATGSGAGCGDHWPLCNGEVLPRSPTAETVVELTHRVTSGLAWVGALVLLVWSRRVAPRGSRLRFAAAASFVLMCTEALVGAGLVLFELVAENRSLARGYWMAAHLTNTFLLLWAMGFAVWSALRTGALRVPRWSGALFGLVGVAFLIVGASGSVAALGATLFPAESIQEGLAQDLSPGAHLFVRLRLYHPILALFGFGLLLYFCVHMVGRATRRSTRRWTGGLALLVLLQVALGFLNAALHAPVWLQIVHLLIADLIWLGILGVALEVFAEAATAPDVIAAERDLGAEPAE